MYKYHSIRGCGRHFAFHNTQYTFYAFVLLLNFLLRYWLLSHFYVLSCTNKITIFSRVTISSILSTISCYGYSVSLTTLLSCCDRRYRRYRYRCRVVIVDIVDIVNDIVLWLFCIFDHPTFLVWSSISSISLSISYCDRRYRRYRQRYRAVLVRYF